MVVAIIVAIAGEIHQNKELGNCRNGPGSNPKTLHEGLKGCLFGVVNDAFAFLLLRPLPGKITHRSLVKNGLERQALEYEPKDIYIYIGHCKKG